MKTTLKTVFVSFMIITFCASFSSMNAGNSSLNVLNQTNPALQYSVNNDFSQFLNLFPEIDLPLLLHEIKVTDKIVPQSYAVLYLIPGDEEAGKSEVIKCVGKFKIQEGFYGILFTYSTETSGDIIELFVFDLEGNFQSSLILGIDYRSYFQTASIDKSFTIKTEAYFRDGYEGGESSENSSYTIVNGIITLN